jgi:hypothetical protein
MWETKFEDFLEYFVVGKYQWVRETAARETEARETEAKLDRTDWESYLGSKIEWVQV